MTLNLEKVAQISSAPTMKARFQGAILIVFQAGTNLTRPANEMLKLYFNSVMEKKINLWFDLFPIIDGHCCNYCMHTEDFFLLNY